MVPLFQVNTTDLAMVHFLKIAGLHLFLELPLKAAMKSMLLYRFWMVKSEQPITTNLSLKHSNQIQIDLKSLSEIIIFLNKDFSLIFRDSRQTSNFPKIFDGQIIGIHPELWDHILFYP